MVIWDNKTKTLSLSVYVHSENGVFIRDVIQKDSSSYFQSFCLQFPVNGIETYWRDPLIFQYK